MPRLPLAITTFVRHLSGVDKQTTDSAEWIEDACFSFLWSEQFQAFRRKYPRLRCAYDGRRLVGGSGDPGRPSADKHRFQWRVEIEQAPKLLGHWVLIVYLNRKNEVTRMYPKMLREARPDGWTVGDEDQQFTVIPGRVHGLWAFVDVQRRICPLSDKFDRYL